MTGDEPDLAAFDGGPDCRLGRTVIAGDVRDDLKCLVGVLWNSDHLREIHDAQHQVWPVGGGQSRHHPGLQQVAGAAEQTADQHRTEKARVAPATPTRSTQPGDNVRHQVIDRRSVKRNVGKICGEDGASRDSWAVVADQSTSTPFALADGL